MSNDPIREALEEFVRNIEDTGGLTRDEDGNEVPVADPTWLDLADTYIAACVALGRTPMREGD